MNTEQQVWILSQIATRDDAGRHFAEKWSDAEIEELESCGLIEIERPVHPATGLEFDTPQWSVEITEDGQELVDGNPEYWGLHELDPAVLHPESCSCGSPDCPGYQAVQEYVQR